MNEEPRNGQVTLPDLSDERVDRIERALFAAIDEEREAAARRSSQPASDRARARRRRAWWGTGAAAAVIAVAALIAPSMPGLLGGSDGASTMTDAGPQIEPGRDLGDPAQPESLPELSSGGGELGSGLVDVGGTSSHASGESAGKTDREIVATASATVRVDDVAAAAERIGRQADAAGGYVEAMSVGTRDSAGLDDPTSSGDGVTTFSMATTDAWITVRVPAAELTATTEALSDIGEVTASHVDRRDVTTEALDLRARVEALTASVERLKALVAEADSTSDLIDVEDALASRQSDLESYQQQLTYLDEQVGMSTLTVSLSSPQPGVEPDPAGFTDGVSAGWNGLLASLNGFVLALGFLLPWIGVILVVGVIVWLVRRGLRGRRHRRTVAADAEG
jgi:hypothetical protein